MKSLSLIAKFAASTCGLTAVAIVSATSARADIISNLIHHYKLNESAGSTTVIDFGSGGDNGTVSGAGVSLGNPGPGGALGTSAGFTGASNSGNIVLTGTAGDFSTGQFSIFAWINTSNLTNGFQAQILSTNDLTAATNRWNFGIADQSEAGGATSTDGNFGINWFHSGGLGFKTFDTITPNDGNWHLVGITRDAANNFTIWFDNQSKAIGNSATQLAPSYDVAIGARPDNTNFWFKGFIDDVRIYTRALTASDIEELMALQQAEVPEPSSFVLMLAGVATIGAFWRRSWRRKEACHCLAA